MENTTIREFIAETIKARFIDKEEIIIGALGHNFGKLFVGPLYDATYMALRTFLRYYDGENALEFIEWLKSEKKTEPPYDAENVEVTHMLYQVLKNLDQNTSSTWDEFFQEINNDHFEGWSDDAIDGYKTCRMTIVEKSKKFNAPSKKTR